MSIKTTESDKYFLRALQIFAHLLGGNNSDRYLEEEDEKVLTSFIENCKKNIPEKKFYYSAGRASQQVQVEELVRNPENPTACLGGLYLFDNYLELHA